MIIVITVAAKVIKEMSWKRTSNIDSFVRVLIFFFFFFFFFSFVYHETGNELPAESLDTPSSAPSETTANVAELLYDTAQMRRTVRQNFRDLFGM